jgi:serine/threonine-protein kinase
LRCLEKQRDARFGSIAELADALLPFAPRAAVSVERITGVGNAGRPQQSMPSATTSQVDSRAAPAATHAAWGNTAVEKPKSARWVLGSVGATVALLAGALVVKSLATAAPVVVSGAGSASIAPSGRELAAETAAAPSPGPPPAPAPPVSPLTEPSVAPSASSVTPHKPTTTHARPKPNTPAGAARDPWGGSQH